MLRTFQAALAAVALGTTAFFGFGLDGATAAPQQRGLVNVALVDTTIQVPIAVAANICDLNVNALAAQLALGDVACGAGATATAADNDNHGASNVRQNGVVNISASDTTIQVPVGVAANLCDINVNLLARQFEAGDRTCTAVANAGAGG
jgi:hypothetical protein